MAKLWYNIHLGDELNRRGCTLKSASRSDYLRKKNQKIFVTKADITDKLYALRDKYLKELEDLTGAQPEYLGLPAYVG